MLVAGDGGEGHADAAEAGVEAALAEGQVANEGAASAAYLVLGGALGACVFVAVDALPGPSAAGLALVAGVEEETAAARTARLVVEHEVGRSVAGRAHGRCGAEGAASYHGGALDAVAAG